jgi:hypothetical protein
MKAAILQSNYIPWKGYFDLMHQADVFVIYDEVQYTKNDWRNRNKIKTPQGLQWLTIPVTHKSLQQKILETEVHGFDWQRKHWQALCINYSKSAFFKQYAPVFENFYTTNTEHSLSRINCSFIQIINGILGIQTRLIWSNELDLVEGKTEKLADICMQTGADEYISGPSAKDYLETGIFEKKGIKITWMDYSGYPVYRQLYPPFEHTVSVLDLIFNEGENACKFLKSFNKPQ